MVGNRERYPKSIPNFSSRVQWIAFYFDCHFTADRPENSWPENGFGWDWIFAEMKLNFVWRLPPSEYRPCQVADYRSSINPAKLNSFGTMKFGHGTVFTAAADSPRKYGCVTKILPTIQLKLGFYTNICRAVASTSTHGRRVAIPIHTGQDRQPHDRLRTLP